MKTAASNVGEYRHLILRVMPAILALVVTSGCPKTDKPVAVNLAGARVIAAADDIPVNRIAAPKNSSEAPVRWADIKDHPYARRADFLRGFAQLRTKVDAQMAELATKRASMDASVNTQEWDFNMKEMEAARSYLNEVGKELAKTPSETWDQAKDKAGLAWIRTQEAYDKVKASTTK